MNPPMLCPVCPRCGQPPAALLPVQAMCGNGDCDVWMWDFTVTAAANLANEAPVRWTSTDLPTKDTP